MRAGEHGRKGDSSQRYLTEFVFRYTIRVAFSVCLKRSCNV